MTATSLISLEMALAEERVTSLTAESIVAWKVAAIASSISAMICFSAIELARA
jgi:hypothetical protein